MSCWVRSLAHLTSSGRDGTGAHMRRPCFERTKKRKGRAVNVTYRSSVHLPTVDLTKAIGHHANAMESSEIADRLLNSFRSTGCVVVHDPRITHKDNDAFLDMYEDYFSRPDELKEADARPQHSYQFGATPAGRETPRCLNDAWLRARADAYTEGNKPVMPHGPDLKWRYFWPLGDDDARERVVPANTAKWAETCDRWGSMLVETVHTVVGLLSVAYGLSSSAFQDVMQGGPHLLAPTGVDLDAHGSIGTVYAGYHYDLNLITAHGRSRYPGLHVWQRDGTRTSVRIPEGCLLLQAGRQLAWLTGGDICEGMHEVVCTDATRAAVAQRAAAAPHRPRWRVSSTVFVHARHDATLQPLAGRCDPAALTEFPPMPAVEQVAEELQAIRLSVNAIVQEGGVSSLE